MLSWKPYSTIKLDKKLTDYWLNFDCKQYCKSISGMSANNIDSVDFEDIEDCFVFGFSKYFGLFACISPCCFIIIIFSRKIQMLLSNLFLGPGLSLAGWIN